MLGWPAPARVLLYLNGLVYIALWLLHGLRLLWFPGRFFGDMLHHGLGPGISPGWRVPACSAVSSWYSRRRITRPWRCGSSRARCGSY
ncbi:hypothetical protein [Arhodomonas sp. AD133]|uniref:hypothetical protein n=1 Tax=Arhodomonas sp. AD133 TaxID=3415009 RepID=UPI003EC0CFD6